MIIYIDVHGTIIENIQTYYMNRLTDEAWFEYNGIFIKAIPCEIYNSNIGEKVRRTTFPTSLTNEEIQTFIEDNNGDLETFLVAKVGQTKRS
jgi:hypothetical protein